jgi:hypothetical protein
MKITVKTYSIYEAIVSAVMGSCFYFYHYGFSLMWPWELSGDYWMQAAGFVVIVTVVSALVRICLIKKGVIYDPFAFRITIPTWEVRTNK